jgi:hypothetical protein
VNDRSVAILIFASGFIGGAGIGAIFILLLLFKIF